MAKCKILHVTDTFGGGVTSAIETYVSLANECEHHLLISTPKFAKIDNDFAKKLSSINTELNNNILQAPFQIYKAFKLINPDYIHLHSSFAGLYGRIYIIPSDKIIYTPHGYAFQRTDISFIVKKIFYLAEYFLTKFSPKSRIATCGPGEHSAALTISKNTFFLPNYANIQEELHWNPQDTAKKYVCMIGRICAQKSPQFFIETYKNIQRLSNNNYQFIWIGDGDSILKIELQKAGIKVIAWKEKSELFSLLSTYNIYFHSAAWDGLPISLLEASKLGIPLVVRETEATHFLAPLTSKTTTDAAEKIIDYCESSFNLELNIILNSTFTQDKLKYALKELYQIT